MIVLAVIIPVFNGLDYTRKCLEVLSNQCTEVKENGKIEIVLVDDGSTDGTDKWVKENYPEVHIVKGDGNLWWSGAVNKGTQYALERCSATHILWWNNDVVPAWNYLRDLVQLIAESDTNTVIGSKIYYLNKPDMVWSMGGYFNPKTGAKDMLARNEADQGWDEPTEVDWFPGMGTVFPKILFETIGYCDAKNFPQYHGDSDFTWRAKLAGFRLLTYPQLKIYNDTSHTGRKHNDSFKGLIDSLGDVKSLYNISKDLIFYRKYAQSPMAWLELVKKYGKYILGFVKWKLLALFGKKRKT